MAEQTLKLEFLPHHFLLAVCGQGRSIAAPRHKHRTNGGFAHGQRRYGWKCEGVGCEETGPTTPKLLDISQKGLLGVAIGSKIEI
ncbi:unnamed protein product [Sphagnum troendelagicum]|uniref:Uncharacterized protein n=1 Tax=Sphagnum troendelagicum TaxID=128251 RepID=A0ABP0U203_9BRYO